MSLDPLSAPGGYLAPLPKGSTKPGCPDLPHPRRGSRKGKSSPEGKGDWSSKHWEGRTPTNRISSNCKIPRKERGKENDSLGGQRDLRSHYLLLPMWAWVPSREPTSPSFSFLI